METFTQHQGIVAPLDRSNVDTDAIIPKQYLKSIKRSGFGPNLFDAWRYVEPGEPGQDHSKRERNADFVLNQPRYQKASILLARDNFGCGSSREHAVWSFLEAGFKTIIAKSFADIFAGNAVKNGLLLIDLPAAVMDTLFERTEARDGYTLTVDLPAQTVSDNQDSWSFEIDAANKKRLLEGLDEIGLTLQQADAIRTYEAARRQQAPWLFSNE